MAPDDAEKPSELIKPTEAAEPPPPTPEPEPAKPTPDAFSQAANTVGNTVNQAFQPGGVDQNKFILVLILSILGLGWVGAILNGQMMKGVAEVVAFVICVATICIGVGAILTPALAILIAVDSILIAHRINQGETFGDWDFFWKPAPPKSV